LSSLDLSADSKIYMRPKHYDEKSARYHVKRVTDILTQPCTLNAQQQGADEEEQKMAQIEEECRIQGLNEEQRTKKIFEFQEELMKQYQSKQEEKTRIMYENFMKLIEQDKSKHYILPNRDISSLFRNL
jgi:F0F1-type ATP synthase gamma subunit